MNTNSKNFSIISVTGTKGKTTAVRMLSNIVCQMGITTLRVDTDGYYINEVQRGDLEESKKLFSLVPTVCPGKYLLAMKKYYPRFVAIFEAAIGSSGSGGLGYGLHQIGIFTNVLEDHMGISSRLKSRSDLAKAKKFIFSRIDTNGTAIFNADDSYVCSQLNAIPSFRKIRLLPVGIDFKYFDKNKHISTGGKIVTVEENYVVIKSKRFSQKVIAINNIKWTFGGLFLPSVYNLMFVVAGIFSYSGKINQKIINLIANYKMDKFGGRLTMFENKAGTKILLDFAHEKYSLGEIAKLGNKLKKNRLIGVVRLAPDRTNRMITDTGKAIANMYDTLIVYDKIDGKNKKRYVGKKINLVREVGEVSQIFYKGILSAKRSGFAERIIIEEKAIERAAEISQNGDVVVIISGDDHKRTISYVRKHFKANFVV